MRLSTRPYMSFRWLWLCHSSQIAGSVGLPSWHIWLLTDLCFLLWILVLAFLPSSVSPSIGLFWPSSRRWMDTSVTDRRIQNVEDSSMLFKADNLHHQDSNAAINDWRKSRRVLSYTSISSKNCFCTLPNPFVFGNDSSCSSFGSSARNAS